MRHPSESSLALYAGKELPFAARLPIAWHVRGCANCQRQLEELRGVHEFLCAHEGTIPAGLNWNALASELKANIRLGLAAGAIVANAEPVRLRARWLTPAMAFPVLVLVTAGWLLESVHPPLHSVRTASNAAAPPAYAMLQSSSAGIGFEKDGRGFTLLHPGAGTVVAWASGEDRVRARYVDDDTGQVMISHVYLQ